MCLLLLESNKGESNKKKILKSSLRCETLPKVSIRLTEKKKKGDLFYMHVSKIDRAKLKRGNDLPDYERKDGFLIINKQQINLK